MPSTREAAALLDSVLRQYPEEKELQERVRLYLNICQKQAAPKESSPQSLDERLYAAKSGGRNRVVLPSEKLVASR